MFKNKKISDINLLFKLSKIFPKGLKSFKLKLSEYILYRFSLFEKDYDLFSNFKKLIPILIELIKELNKFVLEFFENDTYDVSIDIKHFYDNSKKNINLIQSLSDYIDYCMTELFKDKSQEEIEQMLNDIIFVFSNAITAKDLFRTELNIKLAQRLLNNLSISLEYEQLFISKLKDSMGITYTHQMISMLNDIEESKRTRNDYKNLLNNKENPSGIDFNATVIPFNSWDSKQSYILRIEVPKFLQFYLDNFENYYLNKYNSVPRKLNWLLGLSKLNIEYLYLKNKNISISTLPQLLILLCLEKHNKLSIEKISEKLKCDVKIIIDEVKGLIYNTNFNPNNEQDKGVILPNKKEMDNTTEISINKDFNISQKAFSTILIMNENKINEEKLIEEKKNYERYKNNVIQGFLTKIMKSRVGKQVTQLWLINETMKEIYLFKPKEDEIKQCIQISIEKNFLRRVGNLLEYVP